jgi:hypothetical protein
MGIMSLQVVTPALSGETKDACTNVWHAETSGAPSSAVAAEFATEVVKVYKDMQSHLSPLMAWSLMFYKAYDLAQPKPRTPIGTGTMGWSGTSGVAALPTECAVCLSFYANPTSGVSQRRRRGRIYIGPLSVQSLNEPDGRLEVLTHQTLRTAGANLRIASDASSTWSWAVVSMATGTPVAYVVNSGWVDNAYDTQRRRGLRSTTRSTFTS